MLQQPRSYIPGVQRKLAYKLAYWLQVEFATADAAPLTSPYAGEIGSLTVVDSGNKYGVSSGELAPGGSSTGDNDPILYGSPRGRKVGRAVMARVKRVTAFGTDARGGRMGWISNLGAAVNMDAILSGSASTGGSAPFAGANMDGSSNQALGLYTLPDDSYQSFAVVLRSSGAFFFAAGKLIWVSSIGSAATVYPCIAAFGSTRRMFAADWIRVKDLMGVFTTDEGIATLNVASPLVQDYAATADQVIEITLTAPGTITTEAGLIYRKLDANNYWRLYFNTSGALRLDSVSAGVATNRLNVASVISAGGTRTIRVICEGSDHITASLNGTTWTMRGTASVSHQNTQTTVQPDIGAGWTAANLKSYPRSHAEYNQIETS